MGLPALWGKMDIDNKFISKQEYRKEVLQSEVNRPLL